MQKTITELKEKRDWFNNELEDLHIHEPSEEWYKLRRSELEHQIACLEELLDELENEVVLEKNKTKKLMITVFLISFIISFICSSIYMFWL